MDRAIAGAKALRASKSEARLPLTFEFAGSPKAGKSSVIALISLFLRRAGFRVSTPPEGASIETPPDLKDDLKLFNVWCGCYAIQNILSRSHEGDPYDILLLDRGLVDWVVWIEYLHAKERTLPTELRDAITNFALASPWLRRETVVFAFTSDPSTSLDRERGSQLTVKAGRAMNERFLADVLDCYGTVLKREASRLPRVHRIDTSCKEDRMLSFQRIAYSVAGAMLDAVEAASVQEVLVRRPLDDSGLVSDKAALQIAFEQIIADPQFRLREVAEQTCDVQQVVPYGILRREDGRYFCARRRADGERPELAGKIAFLFGGHAERRDWDSKSPGEVLRRCLEREIDEELIGLTFRSAELIAIINDQSNDLGKKHLAFVHMVDVHGRGAIRRQTADREFEREPVGWQLKEEIVAEMAVLDPWSRLVAEWLFASQL